MIKYVVYPGYVRSKYDGDRHYITAKQLIKLYEVNPLKCHIVDFNQPKTYRGKDFRPYISLIPRYNGDYKNLSKLYNLQK